MQRTGLRGHTLFQMLQPEQVARISDGTEEIVLAAGAAVYHHGDPAEFFYVVREGRIALRSAGAGGVSLHVDDVMPGEIFGGCICVGRDAYAMDARCEEATKLMRIRADVLSRLLNADPIVGYAVQTYVSRVYFQRYIETVTKLQAVVQSLPLATT